jgi:hypothetical protein
MAPHRHQSFAMKIGYCPIFAPSLTVGVLWGACCRHSQYGATRADSQMTRVTL